MYLCEVSGQVLKLCLGLVGLRQLSFGYEERLLYARHLEDNVFVHLYHGPSSVSAFLWRNLVPTVSFQRTS